MKNKLILTTLVLSGTLAISATANAQCSHNLLVSGYFSNNVLIFDACSGAFVRNLDDSGRIKGAQAIRLGSDGRLYVVSEGNDRILRYDATTYAFVDTFAQLQSNIDPTGVDFGPDDNVYVASYRTDSVLRLNGETGALLNFAMPSGSGVDGPDNGMGFGPDGLLYVPGYDSDNVVRVNTSTGEVRSNFVPARSGGLSETRGILFEPGGQTFLVSGEGSGAIYRFRLSDGGLVETLITGLQRPTGIALAPDDTLLVLAQPNERVHRFNRETGAPMGSLLDAGPHGIVGGTFLTLVPNSTAIVDGFQIGSQYWIAGAGRAENAQIDIDLTSANGAVFGPGFDPTTVVRKRWGSMRMQFQDCDRATFSYDSTGENSANFGSLSYSVGRVLDSEALLSCRAQGFAQVTGRRWMSGTWSNPQRSGEGVSIEVAADGTAIAGYFTHLPEGF